jgi:transcriptional antiterminator NusG
MGDNIQDDLQGDAQAAAPASVGKKRWYVVHAYSGMEKVCNVL